MSSSREFKRRDEDNDGPRRKAEKPAPMEDERQQQQSTGPKPPSAYDRIVRIPWEDRNVARVVRQGGPSPGQPGMRRDVSENASQSSIGTYKPKEIDSSVYCSNERCNKKLNEYAAEHSQFNCYLCQKVVIYFCRKCGEEHQRRVHNK
jgi:hypothetical protein